MPKPKAAAVYILRERRCKQNRVLIIIYYYNYKPKPIYIGLGKESPNSWESGQVAGTQLTEYN